MPNRLTYLQARLLLLAVGLLLAGAQTLVAWERGAPPTEVLAPILYVPVFAGGIFLRLPGGLAGAAVAGVVYGALFVEFTRTIGPRTFLVQLVTRVLTYLVFGVAVAWATRYVGERLKKLELYDQLDDLTELYNSNFFLEDCDLETSRAGRYRTLFSVAMLDVHRDAFAGFSRRRYERTLRDLAQRIRDAIRRVDRPARVEETDRDRILVILPETGRQGAATFAGRLEVAARDFLAGRGCDVTGHVSARSIAYPDDADALAELRADVARIDEARRAVLR